MGSIPFHEHADGPAWSGRRSFVDLVPYGVVVAGPDGGATWVNQAWTQLTGQTEHDWRGQGWLDVCDGPDREVRWRDLVAAARAGTNHQMDWVISANGRGRRTLHVHAVPDTDGGRLVRIVVTATDVTEDRARSARLLERASHDALTGLLNRAQFLEFLGHALDRRRRATAGIGAVLFIDVDDLKATNDRYGHDEGDRLLCDVAARIKAAVRPADIVARYGGDEFTVLCEDLGDAAEADAIAHRIRCSTRRVPRRDVSIGVAIADGDTDPAALVTDADQAMYEAKGVRWRRRVDDRLERPPPEGAAVAGVASDEMNARLMTIAGLAARLRNQRARMQPGDIDSALASIEHHAQRLGLVLDQLTELSPRTRDQPRLD